MASISGATTSLSSTLQGYGGLASGIDRDSIIEQMTLGTTTKIANAKKDKTELQWKQEAYRSLSDKVLELQDNYFSYSAEANLKDSSVFAKDIVTAVGDSDVTELISASGASDLMEYISILGVKQTATAATSRSDVKGENGSISTSITSQDLFDQTSVDYSNLEGLYLQFGTRTTENGSTHFESTGSKFEFWSSYTDDDGNVIEIDYTQDVKNLVEDLNKAITEKGFKAGKDSSGDDMTIQFAYDESSGNISLTYHKLKHDGSLGEETTSNYLISGNSSALKGMGYTVSDDDKNRGLTLEQLNANNTFGDSYVGQKDMLSYLKDKTLNITYGGQKEEIELLTSDDYDKISQMADADEALKAVAEKINKRLASAFGDEKVEAYIDDGGALAFKTGANATPDQTLTVHAGSLELRENLGISKNVSTKLSMDSSLWENRELLGFTGYDDTEEGKAQFEADLKGFSINGSTDIKLDADMTVNDMLEAINDSEEAGVKAVYLNATNQFALIATKTGSGRTIDSDDMDSVANTIFGTTDKKNITEGKDAVMAISYGNGITTTVTSSTNTFNIEGMKVTVSGTFGYKDESVDTGELDDQTWLDGLRASQSVTFKAEADVENVTEQVKKFVEEYNALVDEIYSHVSTRPDRSYGALTDEQKDEMSEKDIENWENKAKEGLLFSDATVRDLYSDLQNVINKLMQNGVSYADLEEIGITTSDSKAEYGKLVFDESKFKEAMSSDPELVSDIFSGDKGLAQVIEDTLTPYATRYASKNGNSYGRLIEEAGSEKLVLSINDNYIYEQLKTMDEEIELLKERLQTEQDRYIKQFTNMEKLISQYNTQSSYISGLSG